MRPRGARTRRRPGLRTILAGVVAALVAVLIVQGVVVARAMAAARVDAGDLRRDLHRGDLPAALSHLDGLGATARRAQAASSGPVWWSASRLPLVGADLAGLRDSAAVLADTVDATRPAAGDLLSAWQRGELTLVHGRLPEDAARALTPALSAAADALERSAARLDRLQPEDLHGPVRSGVVLLRSEIDRAASMSRAAATTSLLLDELTGGSGPRTWLLLVQNNAEIRATGGMPGSWAVLRLHDGRLALGAQGGAGDIPRPARAVGPFGPGERRLYGPSPGRLFSDVNLSPEFPAAARRAVALFQNSPPGRRTGRVDGVISLDPVALSYLMQGLGEIRVPVAGRPPTVLTGGDVVPVLLHGVYDDYDPATQNRFFQATARATFAAISRGPAAPTGLVTGLARAAGEGRLLLWSADPVAEAAIRGTRVAGDLSSQADRPDVGIYLDDAQASKMDYYLRLDPGLAALHCSASQVQDLRVRARLTSAAPADPARLSDSVAGPSRLAPRGDILINLRAYAPAGGRIDSVTVDGVARPRVGGVHDGRPVIVVPVLLRPGATVTVVVGMSSDAERRGDPVLRTTPMSTPGPTELSAPSACR